jgi:hypothetical protein
MVAHVYNPSYLGGRDQEDHHSKLAQENSSQDPISKIPNEKRDWWSGSSYHCCLGSMRPWVQTCTWPPPTTKKKRRNVRRANTMEGLLEFNSWQILLVTSAPKLCSCMLRVTNLSFPNFFHFFYWHIIILSVYSFPNFNFIVLNTLGWIMLTYQGPAFTFSWLIMMIAHTNIKR